MDIENKNKSTVWITGRGGGDCQSSQTCEFPYCVVGRAEGGAAERKSGGNMEVENITNKHNVWTEIGEYGSLG